ncbi:unnamed protein product [Gemmata massiliana]|uniref:Uncharacterized protein n=1 Tax=Gemmata massiliana TaxID=1210884 RepID=A0A6P2DKC6_9BACT|nr:unnamed protein product [Gemmata massiliana]
MNGPISRHWVFIGNPGRTYVPPTDATPWDL